MRKRIIIIDKWQPLPQRPFYLSLLCNYFWWNYPLKSKYQAQVTVLGIQLLLSRFQLGYWIRTFIQSLHWWRAEENMNSSVWRLGGGGQNKHSLNVDLACRKPNCSQNSAWVRTWSFLCCCFKWQFFVSTLCKVATGAIRKWLVTHEIYFLARNILS